MNTGERGIDLVGALLCREGRVLLGLRAAHKQRSPNRWDMLGGHVEAGETPEQALWRELQEEAGILEHGPARAARVVSEFALDGAVLRVYRIDRWDGEPEALGDEHQRLQWFEPEQAAALPDLADPRLREILLRLD